MLMAFYYGFGAGMLAMLGIVVWLCRRERKSADGVAPTPTPEVYTDDPAQDALLSVNRCWRDTGSAAPQQL